MNTKEIKQKFIDSLYERGEYIKKVNEIQYRVRCPFCGDSKKNENTGHFYIKVNVDDNYPIVYHCFKCEEEGVVTNEVLSALGIDDVELKESISTMNKHSDNFKAMQFVRGEETIFFPYKRPNANRGNKITYIENRLGCKLSDDDIDRMKIITSLKEFLILNKINELTCPTSYAYKIEDHYVGFLSFGSAYILFRDITEKEEMRWIKYPISKESMRTKAFYSMESEIDIFTPETIYVNLAEGILDVLSFYKNLGYNLPNALQIAVSGKSYEPILRKLIMMGFVGDNVVLNIFADNDEMFNKKAVNPTTVNYFKRRLSKMKHLFKEVNIHYNLIGKDFGVRKDQIKEKIYKIF